jgi:hypothetical protein
MIASKLGLVDESRATTVNRVTPVKNRVAVNSNKIDSGNKAVADYRAKKQDSID